MLKRFKFAPKGEEMNSMNRNKQVFKHSAKEQLTKEEKQVYLELLDKICDSCAMQNFLDFLLWKYDDVERVTLKIAWIIENNEEALENG